MQCSKKEMLPTIRHRRWDFVDVFAQLPAGCRQMAARSGNDGLKHFTVSIELVTTLKWQISRSNKNIVYNAMRIEDEITHESITDTDTDSFNDDTATDSNFHLKSSL